MPTQTSRTDSHLDALAFGRRSRSSQILQYELNVIASDAVDVVQSVGGWLLDRRMAGWRVNVLLADLRAARALHILGLTPLELRGEWPVRSDDPECDATLAIAADVFASDGRVRNRGLSALRDGSTEVAVWGEACPAQLGRKVRPVEHRLSAAAHAFKRHALAAAGLPADSVDSVETLFHANPSAYQRLDSDLKPVS